MPDVTPLELGFDPSDPAFIADPYPLYERLRDDHPILWNPATSQWLISRHADVNRSLRDRRLGRPNSHQGPHRGRGGPIPPRGPRPRPRGQHPPPSRPTRRWAGPIPPPGTRRSTSSTTRGCWTSSRLTT